MAYYPITGKTTLSIEKTTNLLRTLPKGFIGEVLNEPNKLVEKLDKYMHALHHRVDEIDVVKSIIETCPEFLATEGNDGFKALPIRFFACSTNEEVVLTLVPLLAEVGRKHGIGGEEERGGLLVKTSNGLNTLQRLAFRESSDIMEVLKNANPPLLLKEDVCNYGLLNLAAARKSFEMIRYMVKLDPSSLYYNHRKWCIPLYIACCYKKKKDCLKVVEYLIHKAASYDTSNVTIGGLFYKGTESGKLILDCMIKKYGKDDTWSCIKQALSFTDIPILHKIIQHSPQNFQHAMTHFPNSILVRDSENRLPIHVALECGMKWGPDIVFMVHANKGHLKHVDPVTKWPAFVLAALDKETSSCDLSTIFFLLREHPEHAETFLMNIRKKKSPSV